MGKRFTRGLSSLVVICAGLVSVSAPAQAAIPDLTETIVTTLGPASAVTSTSVAEQVGDRIWTHRGLL